MWFIWKSNQLSELSKQITDQKNIIKKIRYEQLDLITRIRYLERLIKSVCKSKLGPVGFKITSERNGEGMADMIRFNVTLPPKAAPDVVSRELTISIGDSQEVKMLGADALEAEGFEGPQDSGVVVSLVDIDDSGNRSESSSISFVLADVVPPPMPGTLGVVVLDEHFVDDAVVEPAPPSEEQFPNT